MLNLILPDEQAYAYKNSLMRTGIVFLGGLAFIFCAGILLLIPSVILIRAKEADEARALLFLKKATPVLQEKDSLSLTARTLSGTLAVLEKNEFFEISPLVTAVLASLPKEVRIREFVYAQVEKKAGVTHTLSVKGTSASREALVSFSRTLEDHAFFSEVTLPIGDLVEMTDIPFSLAMTLTPAALTSVAK